MSHAPVRPSHSQFFVSLAAVTLTPKVHLSSSCFFVSFSSTADMYMLELDNRQRHVYILFLICLDVKFILELS